MRHMETYMGAGVSNWFTGFKKRSKKQMRFLRAKYLKVILTCDTNLRGKLNVRDAAMYLKVSSSGGPINIEKLVTSDKPKQFPLDA